VVGVAGFVAIARLSLPAGLDLESARLSVTRNSVIMDRPHLTGFDRRHREYSVSARRAIQPLLNPAQVRLEDIQATFETSEGAMTTVTAEAGDYDHAKGTLKLLGAIAADSPNGYKVRLTDADLDFNAGTVVSENPVTFHYEDSSVTGDRLAVSDGGKLVVIEGNVHTTVMPPKRKPAATAAGTE
jgi:lipopolysaccharide export system protein LptC